LRFDSVNVADIEGADFTVTGPSYPCSSLHSYLVEQLVAGMQAELLSNDLCGAPGAPLFVRCPVSP
jgi:hypothetical protein